MASGPCEARIYVPGNIEKLLQVNSKGSFEWTGSMECLKEFFNEILNTTWTSPGGGSRQFESEEVTSIH